MKDLAAMLKAIHAQENRAAAQEKAQAVIAKLESLRMGAAAQVVRFGCDETLSNMSFPREHWTRQRTNNMLERIVREIRRRTRVVGNFPDGESAMMLVGARLRHVAGTKWGHAVLHGHDAINGLCLGSKFTWNRSGGFCGRLRARVEHVFLALQKGLAGILGRR